MYKYFMASLGKFKGFPLIQYTQTPKVLVDTILSKGMLKPGELNVLLYLVRRIYGWSEHRNTGSDTVALSQFLHGIQKADGEVLDYGAGLQKKALLISLKSLEEKGLIERNRQQHASGAHTSTEYKLVFQNSRSKSQNILQVQTFPVPNPFYDRFIREFTFREKRVFLFLCRWASLEDDGKINISKKKMVEGVRKKNGEMVYLGLDRRNVIRTLKSLEEKNVIVSIKNRSKKGGYTSNSYQLNYVEDPEVVAKKTPTQVAEQTPSPVAKKIPTLSAIRTPHNNNFTINTKTTPLEKNGGVGILVDKFYEALDRRISNAKRDRGKPIIRTLLTDGFTEKEIEYAIEFVARKYPDTKWIERLPFLIDEALNEKKKERGKEKIQQIINQLKPVCIEPEGESLRLFLKLSQDEQERRIQAINNKFVNSYYGKRNLAAQRYVDEIRIKVGSDIEFETLKRKAE